MQSQLQSQQSSSFKFRESTAPSGYVFDKAVHLDRQNTFVASLPGGIVNPQRPADWIDIEQRLCRPSPDPQSVSQRSLSLDIPWQPDIPKKCDELQTSVMTGLKPESEQDAMFRRNTVRTPCGAVRMTL